MKPKRINKIDPEQMIFKVGSALSPSRWYNTYDDRHNKIKVLKAQPEETRNFASAIRRGKLVLPHKWQEDVYAQIYHGRTYKMGFLVRKLGKIEQVEEYIRVAPVTGVDIRRNGWGEFKNKEDMKEEKRWVVLVDVHKISATSFCNTREEAIEMGRQRLVSAIKRQIHMHK